jgi:Zn finger protein HypA/HybF involved in hydrogenase expression
MNKIEKAIEHVENNIPSTKGAFIIEVLEKQKPKKVEKLSLTHEGYVGNCPSCKKFIRKFENECFCNHRDCGQKLDWSE